MEKVTVFEGDELHRDFAPIPQEARCILKGKNTAGELREIYITDDIFSRHIMLAGGIGTGKTNALFHFISQLRTSLEPDDVMIIFDTKGDFRENFYCKGDIVISNDEFATGPEGLNFWNIFREIEPGMHRDASIVEISKTLFHDKVEKSSQPFFPNAAKDLFSAFLIYGQETGRLKDNFSLSSFIFSASVNEIHSVLKAQNLGGMINYIADPNSAQTQGVLSELQQLAREIFIGNFKRKGTLSMRELVRAKGGRVIFIEYDLSAGNMLTPIYSLLFDLAIKEALSRKKSAGNVWFIADEFRLLPHLQHMGDAVNFGRSLGVKFMIGLQNVEQVYDSYGEHSARSILSGFATNIIFRLNDGTSRQYVQSVFGRSRKKDTLSSGIVSRGIIEQIHDANVVEDWDITRLIRGDAIIGLDGSEPFIFRFNKFGR